MNLSDIGVGNLIYKEHEGGGCYVYNFSDAEADALSILTKKLVSGGYVIKEKYALANNQFINLQKDKEWIFAAYYPEIKELRIVTEPDSAYPSFSDNSQNTTVKTTLTQINLEDHGMSLVLTLSDGRFVIFDGGWDFDFEADKLMDFMTSASPHQKPVIAAWIMTHPHIDHYRCFIPFYEKYSDAVVIEKFIYNFPDTDGESLKKVPAIAKKEWEFMNTFYDLVKKSAAPVYRAHTGQKFKLGNADFEVLASTDDAFFAPVSDTNPMSLVMKITVENQVILMTADTYFADVKLAQRWGEYLKSDILFVPHHGFRGGDAETYNLIDPHTCIVPVEESTFDIIDAFYSFNRHLIYNLNVQDLFVSTVGNLTLNLPYTPRPNGRELMLDMMNNIEKSAGCRTWYFNNMSKEDCTFNFVNTVAVDATVTATLFFEDPSDLVKHIKIKVPGYQVSVKDIFNPEDADHDAFLTSKTYVLKYKGVPEGKKFTVKFVSDVPIVITGKKNADYSA